MINIGIVGLGYVGSALEHVFKKYKDITQTETFDIHKNSSVSSLKKLVHKSEIIFLCLPTPMKKDGTCDITILSETVSDIDDIVKTFNLNQKLVVIKSTITIGCTDQLNNQFKNIKIIFNPEFLREASFIHDFENQDRIVIGGTLDDVNNLEKFYKKIFPEVPIIKTSSKIAETTKYLTNAFLATKVSFANEIKTLCDKLDINYNEVVEAAIFDKRLGNSHWDVPGPDGKNGFAGTCLPKDLASLINQFSSNDIEAHILKAVWNRNINIDRKEKDWEKLIGRAVSED